MIKLMVSLKNADPFSKGDSFISGGIDKGTKTNFYLASILPFLIGTSRERRVVRQSIKNIACSALINYYIKFKKKMIKISLKFLMI